MSKKHKVGIWTWSKDTNYGTALQASAMQFIIEKFGYNAELIDYVYDESERILPYIGFRRKIQNRINYFINEKNNPNITEEKLKSCFEDYRKSLFKYSKQCVSKDDLNSLNGEYDIFVCGSDQIWTINGFYSKNFLDWVIDNNRIIAYAPSLGVSQVTDGWYIEKLKELLGRFKYLSVREKSGADIISNALGRSPVVVLDPTLLLTKSEWVDYLKIEENESKNYLLAYFLGNNDFYLKQTYKLAKELGLPAVLIPVRKKDFQNTGNKEFIDPKKFVELFLNASYVCTDSFHGVAFAVNFNKNFCCFKRFKDVNKYNQNGRIVDFLTAVGLNERIFDGNNIRDFEQNIEFGSVNDKLLQLRKASSDYFKVSLETVSNYIELEDQK